MTKEELRTDLLTKDSIKAVKPVIDWLKVGDIDGVQKFDVNVAMDSGEQATLQVTVESDVATLTDSSEARLTPVETFSDELETFIRSKEKGSVFAVVRGETFEADKSALVTVYTVVSTKLVATQHLVIKRDDAFDFKEITA